MSLLISTFNLILRQPLFNALILLYESLPGHDFGIAVIVLTVLIRLILYPVMIQSIKSQKQLQEIQPKIQEIQKKYKDDKQQQAKETMALYQKQKVNPFSGCLPLLIQLPILIALFLVFRTLQGGLDSLELSSLYSFISSPGNIAEPMFLGLINLANPHFGLAIAAGIAQFFQTKMMTPKTSKTKQKDSGQMAQFSNMMQKQMLYFFPAFTIFILLKIPSAVALYWMVSTLFSIAQQYLGERKKGNS